MRRVPRISILVHERDPYPESQVLTIWGVAAVWREWGWTIEVLRGPDGPVPQTDLLIPQIDLTITPEAYRDYIERFPLVANRHITDISKRRISTNLVSRDTRHDGPVIVKTNNNFGGMREAHMLGFSFGELVRRTRRKLGLAPGRGFRFLTAIPPGHYTVFPHVRDVPSSVWTNKRLVVEKYIPERQDDYYCIRVCVFLGDVMLNRRLYSRKQIIKGVPEFSEEVEVPAGLVAIRQRMGFDYGKIDYVMHDGEVHMLDANRTPGVLADPELNQRIAGKLGVGITALLPFAQPPG